LENCTGLQELYCHGCTSLRFLGSLPSSAPAKPSVVGLTSLSLENRTELRPWGALWELSCSGCTSLTSLPLENCTGLQVLSCGGCTSLTNLSLENCTGLQYLDCSGCTSLTSLPLENCTRLHELDCDDCPWIPLQNSEYEDNLRKLIFLQLSRRRTRTRKFLMLLANHVHNFRG
jgi:Leucine-rich repeat (LRR) protein